MKNEVLFSIIMPTYNSEDTIEMALKSIREQDLPEESIEVLVIDGGSTDRTLDIARKYGATILENPKRFPEYAKRIGFAVASGRWIVMEDSDEVLTDKSQLRRRKDFFESNPHVYSLILDKYIPGKNCGIACSYINWFGDPFSYVVYNLSDSRIISNRKNMVKTTKTGNIYYYEKNDIIPIGDGGTTTIDIHKAKELFGKDYYTQEFATSIFYNMVSETQYVGCIPEDNIIHYSVAGFRAYLKKLRFKINTNLNEVEQSGYSVRAGKSNKLRNRKVIFILYAATLIIPFADSIRMVVQYRKPSLLLHFFYTYYTVVMVGVELIKKILKIKGKEYMYGK
ncbi:MAG: glycosyltransferase [Lachnospiraceae bacterium]|nr:glycosyltransferase [Lachnospiraceae bacterium]